MGGRRRLALVGLGCLMATGCVQQPAPLTPAQTLALLQTGQPLLSCREPCLASWQQAEPQAAQLARGARWQDLAVLLLGVRYEDDLTVYYLGRAAEGLGYRRAALNYYRQSAELSRTPASCRLLSRLCDGVVLPRAATLRVAAIEREFRRRRPQRVEPAPPVELAPAQATSEGAVPVPAAPLPAAAPPPPPGPPAPPVSEYIEPPPIAR